METDTPAIDFMSEDSDYQDVDNGGVMLVEDSEDEQENVPPILHQDTPHPAPIVRSLILIKDLAPLALAVEVVDINEGGDDVWYIPPVYC
jgi:hypothetical protein